METTHQKLRTGNLSNCNHCFAITLSHHFTFLILFLYDFYPIVCLCTPAGTHIYIYISLKKKPLDLLHRVLGRRWKFMKFDAKINFGAGFAPTKIAYQHKARAMESLKMQTRGLWKQRTKSYEPGNLSISCIAVLGRRWKFMKYDAKINLGAGFALT